MVRGKKDTSDQTISLRYLLDIKAIQNLSESFTRLTGLSTAILDLDGQVLTASGWQKICTEFHRKNTTTAARCLESDTILANKLAQGKKYTVYKCKNGLVDVAIPLIIEEIHVGNVFTGQFFFEKPDIAFFRHQAEQFDFDKKKYLQLLEDVPIFSEEKIEQAMDFLSDLTTIIGNAGFAKKKLIDLNKHLEKKIEERTAEIAAERKILDSLIQSLPGAMYVIDQFRRFQRWNKNFETVTGLSSAEIAEISPIDLFVDVEDKHRIAQALKKVFTEGSANVEAQLTTNDGKQIPYLFTGYKFSQDNMDYIIGVGLDISERIKTEKEKEVLIHQLQEMLSRVKQLSGFLPICASCKKIRDDEGYWNQIESYIQEHSEAEFSHSLCPACARRLYPELNLFKE